MASTRVDVKPELLRWACDRAGDSDGALQRRFTHLESWIRGDAKPTLRQLEEFARAARVAVGYLFLAQPPVENLPIRDMRTVGGTGIRRPSPDLLDSIYLCQQRQEWYRDFAEQHGLDPVEFVGSASTSTPAERVAAEMRRILDFDMAARQKCAKADDLMRLFVDRIEETGVLVMVSGVVKNSTNRVLDVAEFRGFALADSLAPLIFVNGTDTKTAQVFTLAHELAHLWLGESALSNTSPNSMVSDKTEQWCNQFAAEFLVPLAELKAMATTNTSTSIYSYRRNFKVSSLVILRRLLDAKLISQSRFDSEYAIANTHAKTALPRQGGGDFYKTVPVRASRRFVRAIIDSAESGETTYTEAFQLLGIHSVEVLRNIRQSVGGS